MLAEYRKRVEKEIYNTNVLISKQDKDYCDCIKVLKLQIKENIELGNDKTANKPCITRANASKNRLKQLVTHRDKLYDMINGK